MSFGGSEGFSPPPGASPQLELFYAQVKAELEGVYAAIDGTTGGASALSDLTDYSGATPNDGDSLVYNSATGEWGPAAVTSGGGVTDHGALTGLGDDDHSQYVHISADRTITADHTVSGTYNFTTAPTLPLGTITATMVTQHEGSIDHDALANFVSQEHIRWDLTGAEDIHADRISEASVTQHESSLAVEWSQISATPTTLSGYGITDALSSAYTGDMTGLVDFTAADGLSFSGAVAAPAPTGSQLLVRDQNDGNALKYISAPTADNDLYYLRFDSDDGGFAWTTSIPAPASLSDVGDVSVAGISSRSYLVWTGSSWEDETIQPGDVGATLSPAGFLKLTPGAPPTMDWAGITEADITDLQSYLLPSYSGNISGAWDFTATDGLSVSGAELAGSGTDVELLVRDPSDGNAVKRLLAPTLTSTVLYLRYLSSVGFTWVTSVPVSGDLENLSNVNSGAASGNFLRYSGSAWFPADIQPVDIGATLGSAAFLKVTPGGPPTMDWVGITAADVGAGTFSGSFTFSGGYIRALNSGNSAVMMRGNNNNRAEILLDSANGDFTGSDYWAIYSPDGGSQSLYLSPAFSTSDALEVAWNGDVGIAGALDVGGTLQATGEITAAGGIDLPTGEIFTVNGGTGAITNSRSHDYRPIVVRQSGGTRPTMDDGTILMEYD